MTPRNLHALLFIAGKRHKHERREQLALIAMGSRGDPKAVRKQLKEDP